MKAIAQSAKSAFHHEPPSFFLPTHECFRYEASGGSAVKGGSPFPHLSQSKDDTSAACYSVQDCSHLAKSVGPHAAETGSQLYIPAKVSNADQLCSRPLSDHER